MSDPVYFSLCWYDPQYALYEDREHDADDPGPREPECSCDNCFYGRDHIAVRVIALTRRAEAAEALLRECDDTLDDGQGRVGIIKRIDAHFAQWSGK